MYKCSRCGKKVEEAYNRTLYFNGAPSVETLCEECILKIGREEDGSTDNDNNLSNADNISVDREVEINGN